MSINNENNIIIKTRVIFNKIFKFFHMQYLENTNITTIVTQEHFFILF